MDFIKLSPDQVLEVEFVVLPLMRCRPGLGGKGPVDRVLLIDEFNSVLPGTAMRSSKNSSDPANKSRVYLYQALRNIARGSICSSEDENIFRFRKGQQYPQEQSVEQPQFYCVWSRNAISFGRMNFKIFFQKIEI